MTDITADLSDSIARLGGITRYGGNLKGAFAKAAKAAGISARMARSLYYREVIDPKWSVVSAVYAAIKRLEETIDEQHTSESNMGSGLDLLRERINESERQILECRAYLDRLSARMERRGDD